ncbi:DUF58 domain-containing protein [Saccharophagus degradans]|uniref:DUF58 domain-containing protein n=1 Tax=Saccharophagus degradans TaxID=86304 RepID=UPI001C084229|nr:DUF58 domain-containing protein [Saccharophagus degradans]MBU2984593.1 DUF58 domain-containing protein [Saccharophagus degradans]
MFTGLFKRFAFIARALPSKLAVGCFLWGGAILFVLISLFALLEIESIESSVTTFGFALLLFFIGLLLLDWLACLAQKPIFVERELPHSIAVNRWTSITLVLHHHYARPVKLQLHDGLTDQLLCDDMPLQVQLRPGQYSKVAYKIKPVVRGNHTITPCTLRVESPFRLWFKQYQTGASSEIKVYPDFAAISAFTIMATENHTSQIGIKRRPRRGEGMEFLQLRDYRRGDSLRQIDWKATARRRELISREYQDERDQQIVLLVDSGRRMRALDGELSHFDHSLNAMLLVSYIALRQGDSVSVMSFGDGHRWIPPQKGAGKMKTILNGMYDLTAENCAADYVAAAEQLAILQRKRSLVIVVTNTRDEESDELVMAVNLLRKRHVVLVANIRENILKEMHDSEVKDMDTALDYLAVNDYMQARQQAQNEIRNQGVYAIDCQPSELAVKVANSYIEIKRAGVL